MIYQKLYGNLTLVLLAFSVFIFLKGTVTLAKPDAQQSWEESNPKPDKNSQPALLQDLRVAPLPQLPPQDSAFYYSHLKSLTPRLGIGSIFDFSQSNNLGSFYSLGVHYASSKKFPQKKHWEVGIDILNTEIALLQIRRRWIQNSDSKLRPYFAFGGILALDPADELKTFLRWRNYFAHASLGFEYSISRPLSLRCDLEINSNFAAQTYAGLFLGYAWSW